MTTSIPLIVLALVFALIAVRRIGRLRLRIWQIMAGGALAVLLTGQIPPADALHAIDVDVILFLFGMFVVGQALEESGWLFHLAYRLFRHARSADHLLLLTLFASGIGSAFLMNDTLAIIGTPVVLLVARRYGLPPKMLLLALAFGVTIGSVMSPIGNPQNLLIALHGRLPNPFVTFFRYLLLPTIVNLFVAYVLLRLLFRRHAANPAPPPVAGAVQDAALARLARLSLWLVVLLVFVKIIAVFFRIPVDLRLTYIALISALPIVVFSPRRWRIVRAIDWSTLIFFAAMFVLMESVWASGVFQQALARLAVDITALPMILLTSVGLSQLISNVPLVALSLPILNDAGVSTVGLMALAAGSTVAGNLLILGAASNVIIIQNAENKTGDTLTFLEFARVGVPLTLLNVAVYWLFLALA